MADQELRDRNGRLIGKIRLSGSRYEGRDTSGRLKALMTQRATKHAIRTGGLSAKETFSPRSLPNFDPTPSFCMKTLKIAVCIISAGALAGVAGCSKQAQVPDATPIQSSSSSPYNDNPVLDTVKVGSGWVSRVRIGQRNYIVYSGGGVCPAN